MKNQFLHDLFIEELQDLYSAEQQIKDAQSMLMEKASNGMLKDVLRRDIDEVTVQMQKIEQIAENLDINLEGDRCLGMEGIIDEARKHLEKMQPSEKTDLMLISLVQRMEHYEIAGYGTAKNYATLMNHDDAARILEQISDHEGNTDKELTTMANTIINQRATVEQM